MTKYIYEFIGTFFLVLTVGMSVLEPNSSQLLAPVAIGSILAVMIYMGGYISGGHYNPAVSLAVFLRKKLALSDLWMYWIAQIAAGILAALLVLYLKGGPSDTSIEMDHIKALISEFLFTFALCFVVLNVATTKAMEGNSFYGWAIGFTVLVGAYAVGAISSAAFNPAVAIGISMLNLSHWSNIWVYFAANFLAAIAAAYLYNFTHPEVNREKLKM